MSERSEVQNPMLKYAGVIGWEYVSPADALARRGGDRGLFFSDDLAAQLVRLNPGVLDSDRAAEVIRRLNLLRPTIEGNRDALSWLRGEQSIFVPDENRERNVRLIDFDQPGKNLFHVTDEWVQTGAVYRNRADVVFLINGLPVAVAETKKAAKTDGLEEASSKSAATTRRRRSCSRPARFLKSRNWSISSTASPGTLPVRDCSTGRTKSRATTSGRSRASSTGRAFCVCCANISYS